MNRELIGNDFIEDGSSLMEVLIPPLKQGLRRYPKDRKTRMKDLHYHLENLNKVIQNYSHDIDLKSSQDFGSLKSSSHNTGYANSNTSNIRKTPQMSEVLGSPQSSRPSLVIYSKRSFSLRKSNSIRVRPIGVPTGIQILYILDNALFKNTKTMH